MLEKLEIKIDKWKKKINKKYFGILLFMVFGAMTIFGLEMASLFQKEKQKVQDEYNKAMYQVISYVQNVEVELQKLQLTNTDTLKISTLADIWRQSNLAKTCLDEFPVTQDSMQNASKFLTQVSDYSYSLMKQIIAGNGLTEQDYGNIKEISSNAVEFSDVLSEIYQDLNAGRIKWDELAKIGNEKLPDVEGGNSNIESINKTFQNYEGLIYDGAFSDHILTLEPNFLTGENVSEEEARTTIYELFEESSIESLEYTGDTVGTVELYNYNVKLKEEKETKTLSITKKNRKLYLMLYSEDNTRDQISVEEASQKAMAFLEKNGITDVEETYYLQENHSVTINYAGVQDNVILYPDLIKVKVSLETGNILSYEAKGYIFNHSIRENLIPEVTIEQARAKINPDIEILAEGLAVIPTDSKSEILTYEFKGKIEDREFLIYINASSGLEEKILMILDTPGGTLTM